MPKPRVLIRPPRVDDQPAFLAAMHASRKLHRPWVAPPATPAAFNAFLARLERDDHDARFICLRDAGDLVGVINISNIVRGSFQSAYLGYYAVAAHAGRGLFTEGMRLTLRYVFGDLKLHRVEANIQPDNAASIALVKRCGFRHEGFSPRYLKIAGRWRDHERWAMLDDEFQP